MNLLNNRLLKTELVEWKKLIPFQPDNLKKTEPHKLQKLANSLCENGFSMNFYVWEKDNQIYIIDGHSRQEVLQLLESGAIFPKDPNGKEYQVTIPDKFPCSFLHLKNKAEAKKAVLIYNSKYKSIDSDILAEWVGDLSLDELKSQIEIPELNLDFDMPQDLESDSIDDTAKITTNIKLGDLVEIGNHRLLCGDSTKKEDVERLMNGKKADMVFTDPPYGIDWDTDYTRFKGGNSESKKHIKIKNDNKDFDPSILIEAYNKCFFFGANCFSDKLPKGNWIVWDKRFENDVSFLADAEVGWYNGSGAVYIIKETSQGFVNSDVEKYHPTQKPVNLFIKIFDKIKAMTLLYDPFLGSGTTIISCEQTNRICYGMELEPIYCQVIINRMRKNFPELEIKVNGQIYAE